MAMLIVNHAQGLPRDLRGVILHQQTPFKSCVTATADFNILEPRMEDEGIKTQRCPYRLARISRNSWDIVKAEEPCKKMKKHKFPQKILTDRRALKISLKEMS